MHYVFVVFFSFIVFIVDDLLICYTLNLARESQKVVVAFVG